MLENRTISVSHESDFTKDIKMNVIEAVGLVEAYCYLLLC